MENDRKTAVFHLPGLFEFHEFYRAFLPLYRLHHDWFYENIGIGSIYGSPSDCIWGGGRVETSETKPEAVFSLLQEYGISARLTLSNSLLMPEHLTDKACNRLCELFEKAQNPPSGAIVHSDLLVRYLSERYPKLYLVSSTTKVLTDFEDLKKELDNDAFRYVVPDFRLNKALDRLKTLTPAQKDKTEFLCNECCSVACRDRKACYENVSRKNLGENVPDFVCTAPGGNEGYRFSKAMESPCFIGLGDIRNTYLPLGFTNQRRKAPAFRPGDISRNQRILLNISLKCGTIVL